MEELTPRLVSPLHVHCVCKKLNTALLHNIYDLRVLCTGLHGPPCVIMRYRHDNIWVPSRTDGHTALTVFDDCYVHGSSASNCSSCRHPDHMCDNAANTRREAESKTSGEFPCTWRSDVGSVWRGIVSEVSATRYTL